MLPTCVCLCACCVGTRMRPDRLMYVHTLKYVWETDAVPCGYSLVIRALSGHCETGHCVQLYTLSLDTTTTNLITGCHRQVNACIPAKLFSIHSYLYALSSS